MRLSNDVKNEEIKVEEECIQKYQTNELEEILKAEDFHNRVLFVNSVIDDESLDYVADAVFRYNRYDMDIEKEDREPIIIYINSGGGAVYPALGMIDIILESETPVVTVNVGICASSAMLIFLSGSKRYSFKRGVFLLHDGWLETGNTMNKTKDEVDFICGDLQEEIKNYVIERTKISNREYEKNKHREWYFLPVEAKEIGVVDCIIGEDCKIDSVL